MKYFCTVSDMNYINQGLALYQSLVDNMTEDFELWYLCIDEDIFRKLEGMELPNLVPMCAQHYKALKNVSETSRQGYAWELAARYCKWLLDHQEIDHIMYIDSDIAVYPGFEKVYDEIGSKSIGIVPHLHLPPAPCAVAPGYPGGYNVGITYFKNDKHGKDCLDLWAYSVLNPYDSEIRTGLTGEKYTIKLHNTCGDQRFLEMFTIHYPDDVCIIGNQVTQAAPWNLHMHNVDNFNLETRLVSMDMLPGREWIKNILPDYEKEKPLIYTHFAGFKLSSAGGYIATREAFNQEFLNKKGCQLIYEEYFKLMKQVKEVYDL